jgi:hypothetical protein
MTDTFRQQLVNTIINDFNSNPYFGLYYLDEYNLTIDQWPEFVPLLEKHKVTFIKNMLKGFHDDNYEHIETTLKRLKAVGVKWPELGAIQRSYDSMTKSWPDDDLMEAVNATSEYIDGLADLASNGFWTDFYQMLSSTFHDPNNLPQNLKERLHGQFRSMFLQDFDAAAAYPNSSKMASRYDLVPYLNVSKQDVKLIADKHKQRLMQNILRNVKTTTSIKYWYAVVHNLKDMGVDWPELNTILKSLESSIVSSERPQQLNEIKSQLAHWQDEFTLGFKSNSRYKIEYTLFSILAPHHDNAALLSQVSKMLADTHRNNVLNYLRKQLSATDRRAVLKGIPSVLNFMLIMTPSDWPELPVLLTEYKDRFMRYYLSFFRHGDVTKYISDDEFDVFHKFGIDWPELKTLERSYHAEKQIEPRLDEGDVAVNRPRQLTDDDLRLIRRISALLYIGGVNDALWLSFELPSRVPQLQTILEEYKATVVRYLLQALKDGFDVHSLEIMTDGLARQGIMWPELAIMQKAMYHKDYQN